MYYPYLRGRQFELIALREFAIQRGDKNNVLPIIEPVKRTFNSMKIAVDKFREGGIKFALILNPENGELVGNRDFIDELAGTLDGVNWTPSFIVKNNIEDIKQIISTRGYTNVLLICSKSADSSSGEFFDLITHDSISTIVSEENRTLKRKLKGHKKDLVVLNDSFEPKQRNKDYLQAPEEKFTEEHLFYDEDNYHGFSDYTTVTSEFIEGGSTPYAVAIHLTYQKQNEEIWMKHFTSVSNEDKANIQGKFAEAVEKAVAFLEEEGIHTNATDELKNYYHQQKYPGLGMVKKISIKHHLELVNQIL